MDKEQILLDIKRVLVEELEKPEEKVTPDSILREDLGFDSLDAVDFFTALSEHYGISLDSHELSGIRTVADVQTLIETRLAEVS